MDDKKVRVRILELHNIGGVGNAGDLVWMSAADAEMYVRDGYVEVVEEATPAPSALGLDTPQRTKARLLDHQEEEEDHAIMKPQAKRAKRK